MVLRWRRHRGTLRAEFTLPVEQEAATEKAVSEVHKALGKYLRKEEAAPEKKKDEEVEAMKAVAKKLLRKAEDEKDETEKAEIMALAKKLLKEAEGNANEDVETMLDDVQIDEGDKGAILKALGIKSKKSAGDSSVIKALVPVLENLTRQQAEQGQAMSQMIEAFSQPVQKGLATNYGNAELMAKLQKQLGQSEEPDNGGKAKPFGETPIQKNKGILAQAFMGLVGNERQKAAATR